jgi:hypothetical protein
MKTVVKSENSEDFAGSGPEILRNQGKNGFGNIPVDGLDLLQNDQKVAFTSRVLFADFFGFGKVYIRGYGTFIRHGYPPKKR